jgi:glycosyltransferase involved in cell wall biosynthesis
MAAKISVVICTRDRPDLIGQAVESVASCDYPEFDLHIMDQSATDATEQVLRPLIEKFADRCPIVYHHLDRAGKSRAYNEGFRATDGTLIACTDDDVVVPADWLSCIARAFEGDPAAGLLYGQVRVPESLKNETNVVVPALTWERRQRLAHADRNFKVWGMGANMALRRDLLADVGGFDEVMGIGATLRSSEEYDFALRTYRAKRAILLEPSVAVDHYGARSYDQWPGTQRTYGFGDGAFYAKHIRCGDLLALWLFARRLAYVVGQAVYHSLRQRRLVKVSIYGRSLFTGIRASTRFGVDRRTRLYRETARGRIEVTEGHAISGARKAP